MKLSEKVADELIVLITAWFGASLLFVSAYYQYRQAVKSGQQTDSLLAAATTQLQRTDGVMESQKDMLQKVTEQLVLSEEGLKKTENIIESQRKVIATQEETIKQLSGGNGTPKVVFEVIDIGSPGLYEIDIGIRNDDAYPIFNVRTVIKEPGDVYKQSRSEYVMSEAGTDTGAEKWIKSFNSNLDVVNIGAKSSYTLRYAVTKFNDYTTQTYIIDVTWQKGHYRLIIPLQLKDYVPSLLYPRVVIGDKDVTNDEFEKYCVFKSEIPTESGKQKKIIEDRIKADSKQYMRQSPGTH